VLLDAAAYAPSSALSLRAVKPEFVSLSMYKLFGFPAGVGALVARRDALAGLERPWFAGGTVDWASTLHRMHRLRDGVEGFEDGTPNFSGIASLKPGFDFLQAAGMPALAAHVADLTGLALRQLRSRRHANGRPVFRIYGPKTTVNRGGTIAFNLLNASGVVVDYDHSERWAARNGVAVRGGCFCNPGASEAAFGFASLDLRQCLDSSHTGEFTPRRLGECLGAGVPVGALRISVGVANIAEDVERAIDVLALSVQSP
jgi:selenocysteine lyase/cysteine desulfurase